MKTKVSFNKTCPIKDINDKYGNYMMSRTTGPITVTAFCLSIHKDDWRFKYIFDNININRAFVN